MVRVNYEFDVVSHSGQINRLDVAFLKVIASYVEECRKAKVDRVIPCPMVLMFGVQEAIKARDLAAERYAAKQKVLAKTRSSDPYNTSKLVRAIIICVSAFSA